MDINCPSCLAKLRVDEKKIPPQGAWLKCPKCSEKFIAKLPALSILEKVETAAAPIKHQRTLKEKELLKRLNKDNPEAKPLNLGDVNVRLISQNKIPLSCTMIIIIIMFFLGVFYIISIIMAARPPKGAVVYYQDISPSVVNSQKYDDNDLQNDLRIIKIKFSSNLNMPYQVGSGSTSETRAAYYVLTNCETIPGLYTLESASLTPMSDKSGAAVTLHYSGGLNKNVYLDFIADNHTCKMPGS